MWFCSLLKHTWSQFRVFRCFSVTFILHILKLGSFFFFKLLLVTDVTVRGSSLCFLLAEEPWGDPHRGARKIHAFFISPLSCFAPVIDTLASKQGSGSKGNIKPPRSSSNIISPWIRKDGAHKYDYQFLNNKTDQTNSKMERSVFSRESTVIAKVSAPLAFIIPSFPNTPLSKESSPAQQ